MFDFNDVLLFNKIGIEKMTYYIQIEPSSKNKFVGWYAMMKVIVCI